MDDFVAKPLKLAAIRAALERVSAGRSAPALSVAAARAAQAEIDTARIDQEQLREIRELAGEGFAELLLQFDANLQLLIPQLQEAQARNDAATLRRTAHRLKGTCATMGASGLAELCAQLEHRALHSEPESAAQLLAAILTTSAAVSRALRAACAP